jgi:hypothetical protein
MLIDDALLQRPAIAAASVPTPPAGSVTTFHDSSNGNRLSQKDSTGAVIDLAASGGAATVNYVRSTIASPGLASFSSVGFGNQGVTGTAAAVILATANNYQKEPKMAYRVTTAAVAAVARHTAVNVYLCGSRDITVRIRAGIDTGGNNASKQFFIGLLGTTAVPTATAAGDPITGASYQNTIGIGLDIASTQFAVFSRNGTATTQTSTGIADPTADGTIFFEVVINLKADRTATVNWKELVSGVSGSATYTAAQTPALNTLLCPGAWITSGGVSSVIGLGFGGIEGTE